MTMDKIEAIARSICEAKGYDPDYPTGEHTVQWQSFTELAAIADTQPEAGNVKQAPLVSGGGSEGNRP